VWPTTDLAARTQELAALIAANAPLSVTATKRLVSETEVLPRAVLADMAEMVFGLLKDTADRTEGRRAFAEKRALRFSGL
jgi:1,4-dihydroxy-2-naphthoyl-CoA synthase